MMTSLSSSVSGEQVTRDPRALCGVAGIRGGVYGVIRLVATSTQSSKAGWLFESAGSYS